MSLPIIHNQRFLSKKNATNVITSWGIPPAQSRYTKTAVIPNTPEVNSTNILN